MKPTPRNLPARRLAFLVFGMLSSILSFTTPVEALVRRVPLDHSTIQGALDVATAGDEIRVAGSGSPYVEIISLIDGVSVRGGYSPDFSFRDPVSFETVIQLPVDSLTTVVNATAAGSSVEFDGFTITGGNTTFSGGGMFCGSGSALTVSNCKFVNNFSLVTGGGLQVGSGASPVILSCLFENNTAAVRGGAITVAGGADNTLITRCTIRACSTGTTGAQGGGGLFIASGCRVERCKIQENYSGTNGGGMYVSASNVRAWGNLLTDNVTAGDGGGIYHSGGDGEHNGSLLEGNVAGSDGAGNGGGIYFAGGSNRWRSGFIRGNSAAGNGTTTGLGGGVYFDQVTNGLIEFTEVVENIAPKGAGIYVEGGASSFTSAVIRNNTLASNESSAAAAGGGIHLSGQEIGEIVNNVISHQADGHGIACNAPASPSIRFNCVFAGSSPDSEYGADCPDRTGVNGNIRANPQYCDVRAVPPDVALESGSPCFGTGEGGVDMGAHDESTACGTISIEETSWGKIKSLYR